MPGSESSGIGDWDENGGEDGEWDEDGDRDEDRSEGGDWDEDGDRSLPCSRSRMPVADRGRILVSTHLFPSTPSLEGAHPSGLGMDPGIPLPRQDGQQPMGSVGGSEQERGHGLSSQLTSPSWKNQGSASPASPFWDPMALAQALHGHGHPMGMGGRSHLAGATGTGLSLRNEALAVLHLPALVVAVCGDQGPEGVLGGSGGIWGVQGDFGGPAKVHTLTDGAAPTLGVEGVGAHDGAFQRRAGH